MEKLGLPVRSEKLFFEQMLYSLRLRLRVLSSGTKSFELTNRSEKKDLEEIATLVSITVTSIEFYSF